MKKIERQTEVEYICSMCKNTVKLNSKSIVTCDKCGCKILFKKRINKYTEHLCR